MAAAALDTLTQLAETFNQDEKTKKKLAREKLVRAAPDLLEALKIALLELEYVNRPQGKIAIRKARAAIVKAIGVL